MLEIHMQPQAESSRDATQCRRQRKNLLVDMPAPWLFQLLEEICSWELPPKHRQELGRDQLLHLFRACRVLRDLVLSQRTLVLTFALPIPLHSAAAAEAKLVLASKRSANVTLRLCAPFNVQQHDAGDTEISASSLMYGARQAMKAARFMGGLAAITHVRLYNMVLSTLVPCWLTSTCPNMSQLDHKRSALPLAPATIGLVPCPQLQTLTLDLPRYAAVGPDMAPSWQHQLRALPGLTSLNLTHPQLPPWLVSACSVIGPQLPQLTAAVPPADVPHLPAWFPRLHALQLNSIVDDQGVEVLLGMPQLQRVYVERFQLQHSHAHRPCSWQHLACQYYDVSAFDRLPLEGVQTMGCPEDGNMPVHLVPSSAGDLGASSRVAAAVARCGGIRAKWLVLDNTESRADSLSIAAAMALASSTSTGSSRVTVVTDFTVTRAPVPLQLLAAIKQHLPSSQASTEITFSSCTYSSDGDDDLWPLLLPSLPPVKRVQFWHHHEEGWGIFHIEEEEEEGGTPTEAQITAMCVSAERRVEVAVNTWGWQEGWEQRVRAAMATAGHQHVTLINQGVVLYDD